MTKEDPRYLPIRRLLMRIFAVAAVIVAISAFHDRDELIMEYQVESALDLFFSRYLSKSSDLTATGQLFEDIARFKAKYGNFTGKVGQGDSIVRQSNGFISAELWIDSDKSVNIVRFKCLVESKGHLYRVARILN